MLFKELTGQTIESFYKVYNELGFGFVEKVYENALRTELQQQNLRCIPQFPVKVYYGERVVGEYFCRPYCRPKSYLGAEGI